MNQERENTWRERVETVKPQLAKKRFHLSREQFAKERLHFIKEEFARFQERHPEALSFHMFGSLSKGYAVPESDVDGILFLSWDNSENKPKDIRFSLDEALREFEERIAAMYQHEQRPEDRHLQAHAISHAQLHNDIEILCLAFEKIRAKSPVDFEKMDAYWHTFELSRGLRQRCSYLVDIFMGITIGKGIAAYKKQLLEELKIKGIIGAKIWEAIVGSVRFQERSLTRKNSRDYKLLEGKYENLYPKTIDEAIKYFVERKSFRSLGTDK